MKFKLKLSKRKIDSYTSVNDTTTNINEMLNYNYLLDCKKNIYTMILHRVIEDVIYGRC